MQAKPPVTFIVAGIFSFFSMDGFAVDQQAEVVGVGGVYVENQEAQYQDTCAEIRKTATNICRIDTGHHDYTHLQSNVSVNVRSLAFKFG